MRQTMAILGVGCMLGVALPVARHLAEHLADQRVSAILLADTSAQQRRLVTHQRRLADARARLDRCLDDIEAGGADPQ